MLRVLLAKDLLRAWRNPLPWLINLVVPLALTGLIGLVFGGKSDGGALGTIRFAVVNEDQPVLSDFLRGAANHGEGGKFLDPVFLERDEALRQINKNQISAVLIIPTNFVANYLTAREPVSLELIKNPAESIHPAVLEELLGAAVTALNALSRNFHSDFPEWRDVFEDSQDYHKVSILIESAGKKFDSVKKMIHPPLVSYEKEDANDQPQNAQAGGSPAASGSTNHAAAGAANGNERKPKQGGSNGVFAYLLAGLSAMFLLFLGSTAMTDLHHEVRQRTFERYQTMRTHLWPFIVGKVIFAVVVLLICAAVMLGGGGLIFRVHWREPVPLMALTFGYTCFVASLFAVLVAVVPDERRAGVLNNLAGMGLGLVGGCAFPPEHLPTFLRDHVTPLMPSHWYVETVRNIQFGSGDIAWGIVLVKLAVAAVILVAIAAVLFRRRFKSGLLT